MRGSAGQPLCHHLTIHDGDVNEEEQNDKEIIHEAQQADHTFWDKVQWGRQVGQRSHQTQQNPNAKHPEETADGEHLSESVPKQRGHVSQAVHKLQPLNKHKYSTVNPAYRKCTKNTLAVTIIDQILY